MAHLRKRHLEAILHKVLGFSSLVGVIGHRQVGKSSLVSLFSGNYLTLDDSKHRALANLDPEDFLDLSFKKNHLMVIDECQKAPPLFDALKEVVRKNKKPGQFLLTGSVRFTSKKIIRESLTGRIINLELLPLTISELAGRPLSQICQKIMAADSVDAAILSIGKNPEKLCPSKLVDLYMKSGGLPGVCFIRDKKLQELRLADYLNTILDRDLREVCQSKLSYSQILDFLSALAKKQGQPIDHTDLQRDTEISIPTQKKLLLAFEAVFLLRLLKIEGGRKGFICFLEDQYESNFLAGPALTELQYRTQCLYRNIRAEFFYSLGESFRIFHYLTRHKTTIPFAVQTKTGCLGFLPLENSEPSHGEQMAAQSFVRNYKNAKVVLVHRDAKLKKINSSVMTISDRCFH